MLVATPIGLLSVIYLTEYATPLFRAVAKPTLEVLAGIPTVVYGFFAILTVSPALRTAGAWIGLEMAPNSALAAGAVMGLMIIRSDEHTSELQSPMSITYAVFVLQKKKKPNTT